nr:MAG TPA: hypothetical protein [Caudoviricetes sp.]
MVVVKTDTEIFLNVEEFCARGGDDFHSPGLYIKTTGYDKYVSVVYCDVEKARDMLCDIASEIGRYRADGLVLEIHGGKISRL